MTPIEMILVVISDFGQVFSFGWNVEGQLGDGTNTNRKSPVAVDTSGVLNNLTIVAIACGSSHSLLLSGSPFAPFLQSFSQQLIQIVCNSICSYNKTLDKCFHLEATMMANLEMVLVLIPMFQLQFPHQVF